MSELESMLERLATRLFEEHCTSAVRASADAGEFPSALWDAIASAGLPTAMVAESLGGAGTTPAEAAMLMRLCGRHAVPVPLVESLVAGALLSHAGLPMPPGIVAIAPVHGDDRITLVRDAGGWRISGVAADVPWARASGHLATIAFAGEGRANLALVPTECCTIAPGAGIADEPRDTVTFDAALEADRVRDLPGGDERLLHLGALARCHQMCGAMEWILERSCAYAGEREQFGRRIGGFQSVQQMLAQMAGEVAAARMAADCAQLESDGDEGGTAIGYAKARVGEAAGRVAALAHQVHGAIGYSHEYALHHRTRRLWAWRDEFGAERFWQLRAGRRLAAGGGARLWQAIAG